VRAATARITEEERRAVAELLGPRLHAIYQAMRRNDQRHGLDVMATLHRLGEHDRIVLQSALLHDSGKALAPFTVIERSLAVFLQAVAPPLFAAACRYLPPLDRRYRRYCDHARLGAELVLRAGGEKRLAQVIAEHHGDMGTLPETQRLRTADRLN
jgi:putative nucleotidyltransferase with HDIG domain